MSEMVNQFKNRFDKFWSNQDLIYNYKAELTGVGNRSSIWIVSIFTYLSVLYDVDIQASAWVLILVVLHYAKHTESQNFV